MRARILIIAAILGGTASVAGAAPAYKSQDVVDYFVKSAQLGSEKGICVGTAQECAKKGAEPAQGFNTLVTFDLNSDHLTPAAKTNLAELAKALKDPRLDAAKFKLEGHTDARGDDSLNDSLSLRRANAVQAFLLQSGVSSARLQTVGLGKRAPRVADPFNSENRRVEAKIQLPN